MKYFTQAWWNREVEDTEAVVADYWRYIGSIRSKLTPELAALLDDVSLHDSKVRRFSVDIPGGTVSLTLHGFVNPWSPEGQTGRRIFLRYNGVESVESINESEWTSESLDNSDLGYCEIEWLSDGLWEHRMLFASGIELTIRFQSLELRHEALPDKVTR